MLVAAHLPRPGSCNVGVWLVKPSPVDHLLSINFGCDFPTCSSFPLGFYFPTFRNLSVARQRRLTITMASSEETAAILQPRELIEQIAQDRGFYEDEFWQELPAVSRAKLLRTVASLQQEAAASVETLAKNCELPLRRLPS